MAEPEAAASSAAPAAEEPVLEEESTAIFKPVVELKEEVKVATGTENEESIFKMYVFFVPLSVVHLGFPVAFRASDPGGLVGRFSFSLS